MATLDNLHVNLQVAPALEARSAIINSLWQSDTSDEKFPQESLVWDSFFEYYNQQCAAAIHDGGSRMILRNHHDLIEIINNISDGQGTRSSVKTRLCSKLINAPEVEDGDELLCSALDLGARILLMTSIGTFRNIVGPAQRTLQWQDGENLQNLLSREFTHQRTLSTQVKLERLFNARTIERIAGIKITWTSNLADHLRLLDDDTRVVIFPHASFLKKVQSNNIFPPGLIEETLRTLALLLPEHDPACRKWFKQHKFQHNLDSQAQHCGHLSTEERQIHKFQYWHDRLVILKQTFDEEEPSTIYQWWHDRRRRVQWYTFWVAALVLALTILFGFVQCIEGALQAYKAYYPS